MCMAYYRFGIQHTTASLQAVWEKILKNREGTVSYHEFIRHFGASRLTIKCEQKVFKWNSLVFKTCTRTKHFIHTCICEEN